MSFHMRNLGFVSQTTLRYNRISGGTYYMIINLKLLCYYQWENGHLIIYSNNNSMIIYSHIEVLGVNTMKIIEFTIHCAAFI